MVTNYEHDLAIDILARECIEGRYGNGRLREKALGELYYPVQSRVNDILSERIDVARTECMKAIDRYTEQVDASIVATKEAKETMQKMQEGLDDISTKLNDIRINDIRNNMIRI